MNQMILGALIGYFMGNFMTAFFLGKCFKGIDVRQEGTKNVGASNAVVTMGWKYGVATWALDILKTTAAVLIAQKLFPGQLDIHVIAGFCSILGHMYPIILGFKGGKGASSVFGMMLGLNWKVAIIMAITLTIITLVTDYIALGTISMFTIVMIYFIGWNYGISSIIISAGFLALVIYKHKGNISRIIKGEELGLRATKKINKERKKEKEKNRN